jgi:hypothetical protein
MTWVAAEKDDEKLKNTQKIFRYLSRIHDCTHHLPGNMDNITSGISTD